jgi:tryptophan 2,3-dioxygenase
MSSNGLLPFIMKLFIIIAILASLVLLVTGEFIEIRYGLSFWNNVLQELASVVLISGTVTIIFEYLTRRRQILEQEFEARRKELGLEVIYETSSSSALRKRIEELIASSKNIAWVGTAIHLLDIVPIWDTLIGRAQSGESKVEIYLANPYSRHVNARLIEEKFRTDPTIGREGIINRIEGLLSVQARKGIPNSQLQVRLFNHYPTAAILVFDSYLVVYHYGYQELGNLSPAFCYRRQRSDLAGHYLDMYQRIKRDSVPAKWVMREHGRLHHSQEWARELSWFAVYLVPERNSEFYQVWSKLVGYDIWQERELEPPSDVIKELRGNAHTFGCHITLLDAMGVWSEAQLGVMREELCWLASQYQPTTLRNLGYLKGFKKNALVAGFADDSGQLESLQAELLVRFATQAATSNYKIEGHPAATLDLSNDRIRHMTARYHTPFCLSEFQPHVTVLGDLKNKAIDRAGELVAKAGGEVLETASLHFDAVCFMERSNNSFWRISEKPIQLGK